MIDLSAIHLCCLVLALAHAANALNCSETTGHGSLSLYELVTSDQSYTSDTQIHVTLQMNTCLDDYDQHVVFGPSRYIIKAVYENTEVPAPGEFTLPSSLYEAKVLNGNAIVFDTRRPSLLDLPVKYGWATFKEYNQTLCRRPICFKTTLQHYSDENTTCEVSLTHCIPSTNETVCEDPTPPPSPPPTTVRPTATTTEPPPERVERCMKRWSCETARLKDFCGSNGVTYPSRCHWRRAKCIYNIDIKIVKGACPSTTTPLPTSTPTPSSSTLSPTPSPTPLTECERTIAFNKKYGYRDEWHPECSHTGKAKPVQCLRESTGQLKCWCSLKDLTAIGGTEKIISENCASQDINQMNCLIARIY